MSPRSREPGELDEAHEPVVTLRLSIFEAMAVYAQMTCAVERDVARVANMAQRGEAVSPQEPIRSATTARAYMRIVEAIDQQLLAYKQLYRNATVLDRPSDS